MVSWNIKMSLIKAVNSTEFLYKTAVFDCFYSIVKSLFFLNVGIGFITKSAPQLNLFSFGFPLTIPGIFFCSILFGRCSLQFVFSDLIDKAILIVKTVLVAVLQMAENDQTQGKTQEPTQRRLEKAREDGDILSSKEMFVFATSAIGLLIIFCSGFLL